MAYDKDDYLKKKYGITLQQYNEMLKGQNYSCAICNQHESNFKKKLAVDHDHKTNEVRGLLCFYCNKRVVGQHTSVSVLKLVRYLLPGFKLIKKRRRAA